jgi:xanthine dehydrogenase/oxidase
VIDHLATACKVPGDKIRKDNFYQIGQHMHFGMIIGEQFSGKWNVPSMWDRIFREQNVVERRKEIDAFNAKHKWVKRGLAVLPTKFGIAFTAKFMNQGGALVHLYTDGTVLVSHGGTEMGQGLHTKVCQVAAQAFGIPLENVYVNDSSSDKVPNAIPTAASMSTDMYGMATLDACRQIIARIKPIQDKLGPSATLKEVALAAHMERIDLSAHGFFALDTTRCGFDWTKNKPEDFPDEAPENSWKGHPFN